MLVRKENLSEQDRSAQKEKYCLSVIIPFRADPSLPYLLVRLEEILKEIPRHPLVEILLVDSGSSSQDQKLSQDICKNHSVRYLYHDSTNKTFSIGAARDFGVCHAQGAAITFLDIDLRINKDFWNRLLILMEVNHISNIKKTFFVIPCLYLSETGTQEFQTSNDDLRFYRFWQHWLMGNNTHIETLAPCSSVMVVDRLHYMSVGGHRPEFRGHGYEDFELYHRLTTDENILPRPRDYYKDTKNWDSSTYVGFRSQFSLLGRQALMSNLFVVHLWHPRPKTNSFYKTSTLQTNRTSWLDFFEEFDKNKIHPEALTDSSVNNEHILFFGKPSTNASNAIRDIFPLLGKRLYISEFTLVDENHFLDRNKLENLIAEHDITRILFPNPYGNIVRLQIYQWAKENKFPFYCWERGALPDSWFFDPNGFNADSSSYHSENWDHPLTEEDYAAIKEYIHTTLTGNAALEDQGVRVGGDALAQTLKLGGRKVLFVPMQRPSDTVIKYMSDKIYDYNHFMAFIDEVAKRLQSAGWVVLCKRHPLETTAPKLQYAQYVHEDTHFVDLIEVADAVALVNSGVGVYAAMMNKPCYTFGNAFYSHAQFNKKMSIHDIDKFLIQLKSGFTVDKEAVWRFIYYLKNDFYSFGTNKTLLRTEKDGSLRNITTAINFYQIIIPNKIKINYEPFNTTPIMDTAPLFERFKLDIFQWKKQQHSKTPIQTSPTKPVAQSAPAIATKPVVTPSQVTQKTNASTQKPISQSLSSAKGKKNRRAALLNKLRHKPHQFFKDSRSPILRPLQILFHEN